MGEREAPAQVPLPAPLPRLSSGGAARKASVPVRSGGKAAEAAGRYPPLPEGVQGIKQGRAPFRNGPGQRDAWPPTGICSQGIGRRVFPAPVPTGRATINSETLRRLSAGSFEEPAGGKRAPHRPPALGSEKPLKRLRRCHHDIAVPRRLRTDCREPVLPDRSLYRRDIRPRPLRRDNADRQPRDGQGNRPGRLLRARRRRQGRRRGAQGF